MHTSLDQVPEAVSPEDLEAASAGREWESLCRGAIGELPEEQRLALELAYFEGALFESKDLSAIASAENFAVTVEPQGGVPHPTGPIVLIGTS